MSMVDVRCPANPSKLLMKLRIGDAVIVDGNLIEVACDDCRRRLRPARVRVLHRFDLAGHLIETDVADSP